MRVLICDDEIFAVEAITKIVKEYFDEHNLTAKITTETRSSKIIAADTSYDIALLDIEMPENNGLQVARHLMSVNPDVIIFIVTSHSQYLDSAMDLRVLRYLPKPPDRERIFSGLDSAIKLYINNTKVLLLDSGKALRVYVRDILYIIIQKRKTLIVTKSEEIMSNRTLSEWKEILGDMYFAQPHYSYLVNLQNVLRIEKNMAVLKKNDNETVEVNISQRKYKDFRKKFFDYLAG